MAAPSPAERQAAYASPARSLAARWAALDGVQRGLLGLMAVRWAIDLLLMVNVLPLENRYGWYLHHGGDQELMLGLARSLLTGAPEESVVGLGQALVMIPWVLLIQPYNVMEIAAPLVVINGFLLGGLSVVLVGLLARALFEDKRVTLGTAALWALLPLAAYWAFFWHPERMVLRSTTVPKLGWLNGLSDAPATFFLLLATVLLARLARRPRGADVPFWPLVAVGASLALSVTFRFHVITMAGFLMLAVWLLFGGRAFAASLGAALIAYLPQAWYNQVAFNLPFTTGYISVGDMSAHGGTLLRPRGDLLGNLWFSPINVLNTFNHFIGRRPWLLVPLVLGLAAALFVVWQLRRARNRAALLLLVGAPLAYLLPMLAAYNFREDVIRFAIPILPAALIVAVYSAVAATRRQAAATHKE